MPSILLSFLELIAGILLLFSGGELFIQGSVALALILGIPQLVIGLTIVSLGTSAPELFVSVNSSLTGSDSLALSNIVGSNIFNVMVVLGGSALLRPLRVESRLVRRDIPLLLAVSTAVWGMAASELITWQFGLALIVALIINTTWEIRTAREEPQKTQEAEPEINIEKDSTSLLNSGALFIAKTVTAEFAISDPGETRNPRNLEHTPGGSSSGSGASVAAGFCDVALGTQTCGSVIRPAGYCGVIGYKPSFGRISRDGVLLFSKSMDHVGIIAKNLYLSN